MVGLIFVRLRMSAVLALALLLAPAAYAAAPADPNDEIFRRDGRRFALDLYARLATEPGNLFFSPWSIRTALGMVYAGARSHTEQQMALALHDSLGQSRLHIAAFRLDRALRAAGDVRTLGVELLTANAVWVPHDIHLEPAFTDTVTARYAAPSHQIDFGSRDGARSIINAWVEEQTRARIRDLIPTGALDHSTRLVLCDAIYFRGAWRDSFRYGATETGPFHLRRHYAVNVPFMHASQVSRHAENLSLQVLELPYSGDSLALLIILPRDADGIGALEQELDPDSLADWESRMERVSARLTLPRFTIEGEIELAEALAAMGMGDAFTVGADFSGISHERPLFISAIYHKAFVAVDEYGTEATAATALVHTRGGNGAVVPQRQVTFTADHPFLFLIRHRPSGAILFMGRLVDPR
ncbi:MAG: serpin family protein [Candidatus Eisenbacteria bacterium]